MHKIIFSGLTILSSILSFSLSTRAETKDIYKDCTGIIISAVQNMENGRDVLVNTRMTEVLTGRPNQPDNRPYGYTFIMHGTAATSIMSSHEFRKIIATRIIRNCNSVASVSFILGDSDDITTIGLMKDGTVKEFKCLTSDETEKIETLGWGYEVCD